ncbi:MAG: F0F1 ATP synthase subunit C [Gammaproteobacteria bacterium]|nr:F0F1 ATP synthase subunit C [Gammaproteobacteria bacterium]MCI0590162.1 F0F1 ATP synthase subunit C [Gammaproteobacteria bacterium]
MTADANLIAMVYAYTALGVGVILAAAGLGSALGWGLICAKYMEGIARQPELLPALRVQMFITAGLMESFPFIVLAFAMYFTFANPFIGAALATIAKLAGGAG